jgi:hypothetical protein
VEFVNERPIAEALPENSCPTIRKCRTQPSKHASGVEAAGMRKKKKPLRRKIVLRLPDLIMRRTQF